MNILLGATGSVATIKYFKLWDALEIRGEIKGVATEKAFHFLRSTLLNDDNSNSKEPLAIMNQSLRKIAKYKTKLYCDEDEWEWQKIGDTILHIELRDWADVLVIAPLSANTLAKMTHGICDNLLTCIYRAWPIHKPIVLAPAMNTEMWNHPITQEQLDTLEKRHMNRNTDCFLSVVSPVAKKLACGTTGIGAMAHINDIVRAVESAL